MKRALIAILILAALIFGSRWMNTFSWNQRMTITIDTPAGEVSGSAVTSISWREATIKGDGMGWDYDVSGEAVVVEVIPGEYLFALLEDAGTTEFMGTAAAGSISGQKGRVLDRKLFAEIAGKRGRASGAIAVPEYQYPLMVTFDDIIDPTTVRLVDPLNLAATFGMGVSLKSISLEITGAPVTVGPVEKLAGWLGPYPETRLMSKISPTDFSPEAQVDMGMFIRRG